MVDAHVSVLLDGFVDHLITSPSGQYIDATFGRGGHATEILKRLDQDGRLLGLDRDPDAVRTGEALQATDSRFSMSHLSFSELSEGAGLMNWPGVDGIGFDLGVSSPQLDNPARGFSFQSEGPLDMRMDTSCGRTLLDLLKKQDDQSLARTIWEYGDERFSRSIARNILKAFAAEELHTTSDLADVCVRSVPGKFRHGRVHPATRTFQALRMWVNDEVVQLSEALASAMRLLKQGGRLAVISFHSGEDRIVRDMVNEEVKGCVCPPEFPICQCGRMPVMKWIQKKPMVASDDEIEVNPRARSARMRVAEKL